MLLVDEHRRVVDANAACLRLIGRRGEEIRRRPVWELIVNGPLATEREWRAQLALRQFTGETELRYADGTGIPVQWGATTEIVTGRRLVLFVVISQSRWGSRFRRPDVADSPAKALTAREREVVRLVAMGSSGPEIADELQITHDTVRTHVRHAMEKLGARSRAHLVAKALGTEPGVHEIAQP